MGKWLWSLGHQGGLDGLSPCGSVFNRPLRPAIQGAARVPLTFTIQDIANRLPAGGATEARRVAR
jgi:hypothetical protein